MIPLITGITVIDTEQNGVVHADLYELPSSGYYVFVCASLGAAFNAPAWQYEVQPPDTACIARISFPGGDSWLGKGSIIILPDYCVNLNQKAIDYIETPYA